MWMHRSTITLYIYMNYYRKASFSAVSWLCSHWCACTHNTTFYVHSVAIRSVQHMWLHTNIESYHSHGAMAHYLQPEQCESVVFGEDSLRLFTSLRNRVYNKHCHKNVKTKQFHFHTFTGGTMKYYKIIFWFTHLLLFTWPDIFQSIRWR